MFQIGIKSIDEKFCSIFPDTYRKLLLIVGFGLTVNNLQILFVQQPAGYVVDIYSVLPLSFYGAAILCYLFASIALFSKQDVIKKLGVLLLVINHAVILIIPYMLGYYSMGRADDMSYIGEYVHISTTGSFQGWDIYPAAPILGATITTLTGLPANYTAFLMPFIFSFILIGGLYMCCRFFLKEEMILKISILASFILYLGPYNFLNVPHALFFAYMPIYIFILSRFVHNSTTENALIILIPTVLVPFMHPFIVFFVSSLLILMAVSGGLLNRIFHGDYRYAGRPLIVLFIGFLSWFIYSNSLLRNFSQQYQSFIQKTTEPVLFETTDKLAQINIDLIKIIKLLFVYYSRYFIPLLIIIVGFGYLYINRKKISERLKNQMAFFSIFYIVFLLAECILFLNPIISHQPDRITNLNFMVYAQVPLFALSLYIIFSKTKYFCGRTILLIFLLTGIWSLSLFGVFDSPNIFKTNDGLTYNEVEGMTWFYEVGDYANFIAPFSQIGRFRDLFDYPGRPDNNIPITDHFGYDSSSRTFANINLKEGQKSYIILLTVDELRYQKVPGYMEVGRYGADDFIRFRHDPTINKVYQNTNIEIFDIV
ncbi:hypothetical protein [Methanosphaerula subterraneus]|uniref:hypothetical protein n=1 Tax=Methanosphaerula subterraneus TaxID=3350244 RepID=UPI003F82EBB3